MGTPNIFAVMQTVSRRVEPYHSAFLAAMLKWSHAGDRRLFDAFWLRAAPSTWGLPGTQLTVLAEDVIGTGRVDLVLLDGEQRVLGIEVKTSEASTTQGQLEQYRDGLVAKYPGRELAIAYLTPFDRTRAGDMARTLPSIREFDQFAPTFPLCRHLSWLDIAEIEWDAGEVWLQHSEFVRMEIASEQARRRWMTQGRTRGLAHFFGAEAAEVFDQTLHAVVGEFEGYVLRVERVQDPTAFAAAFRVLIESAVLRGARGKQDAFDAESRVPFLKGPTAPVHHALFALAAEYPNVWVEGKVDYGLRVAHPNHPGGVSLATSSGVDWLEIGRPR